MKHLRIADGKVLFSAVMNAIRRHKGTIIEDEEQKKTCHIVWFDTLKEADSDLICVRPWQLVNRIPGINCLCRKASLFRLLMRLNHEIPEIFNFFPKTFIIPQETQLFDAEKSITNKKYIYKPDNGS